MRDASLHDRTPRDPPRTSLARELHLRLRPSGFGELVSRPQQRHIFMDKDRIKGAVNQAKGTLKETVGKVTGDVKLGSEGKADKLAGKLQNAIGGIKDTVGDSNASA